MKFRMLRDICLVAAGGIALMLQSGCVAPVDDTTSDDYIEFESVWQYLKAYSIYQDSSIYEGRIPADPFVFSSPEALMKAVGDTIYSVKEQYTHYALLTDTTRGAIGKTPAVSAATPRTVVLDTLTDSTVRISISSFEYGSTYKEFIDVLPGVQPFPYVIVDLRDNGGGDIDDATLIVNAFLPAGTSYLRARERVYDTKAHSARTDNWHPWKTKDVARPELNGKKIIVLMNNYSASASEILIAALKDCRGTPLKGDTVTLVGSHSYGKGIGQIKLPRRDRKALQITFLQMRGMSERVGAYHHKGIAPDLVASGTDIQQLLTAVRVHEPSISQLRRLRKQAAATPSPIAGYRIVYEE